MKVFSLIAKIVTALAAVAGAVYVCATYGDQIVAWAKKVLASLPKCKCCEEACECEECDCACGDECACEEPAEEEAPAEEAPVEEAPAEASGEAVADEADFAE